ncbi:hypothetical protein [Streptomyces sp. NRRL WC-3742]|uniref:hypothetical protein n=1 Tax=Streptomyces sp. NRRL WC-3742 TaxID=1463934 RepID=UPI000AA8F6CB|nr:hypothetical protein [Streptomyces sp. NRRL WC-3742]
MVRSPPAAYGSTAATFANFTETNKAELATFAETPPLSPRQDTARRLGDRRAGPGFVQG